MQLELQSASKADLEATKSIHGPETGDLAAPAMEVGWPVESHDLESARQRAAWSAQQQIDIMEHDATARWVKVVDKDDGDSIVTLGRWHRYTDGYPGWSKSLELCGKKNPNDSSTWPAGFANKDLVVSLLSEVCDARNRWIDTKQYWILTTVVTRAPLRKLGAASMVLRWGLEQAAKEGLPAYLEAEADAVSLYQKHGFYEVGKQDFDCSPFGMSAAFTLLRMKANPE